MAITSGVQPSSLRNGRPRPVLLFNRQRRIAVVDSSAAAAWKYRAASSAPPIAGRYNTDRCAAGLDRINPGPKTRGFNDIPDLIDQKGQQNDEHRKRQLQKYGPRVHGNGTSICWTPSGSVIAFVDTHANAGGQDVEQRNQRGRCERRQPIANAGSRREICCAQDARAQIGRRPDGRYLRRNSSAASLMSDALAAPRSHSDTGSRSC